MTPAEGRDAVGAVRSSLLERVLERGSPEARATTLAVLARLSADSQAPTSFTHVALPEIDSLIQDVVGSATTSDRFDVAERAANLAAVIRRIPPDGAPPLTKRSVPSEALTLLPLGIAVEEHRVRRAPDDQRPFAMYNLAQRLQAAGDEDAALGVITAAVRDLRERHAGGQANAHLPLAASLSLNALLVAETDVEQALTLATEAVTLFIDHWDAGSAGCQFGAADACETLGWLSQRAGNSEAARHWYTERAKILESLATWRPQDFGVHWIQAQVDLARYTTGLAIPRLTELLARLDDLGWVGVTAAQLESQLLRDRGQLLLDTDPAAAFEDARRAVAILRPLVDLVPTRFSFSLIRALRLLARVLQSLSREEAAARVASEAAAIGIEATRSSPSPAWLAELELEAARAWAQADRTDRALAWATRSVVRRSLALGGDLNGDVPAGEAYLVLGNAAHRRGDYRLARISAERAIQCFRPPSAPSTQPSRNLALVWSLKALVELDDRQIERAIAAADEATAIADELTAMPGGTDIDVDFAHLVARLIHARAT